jgi:CubicO group peptidase (beta-lactamase class C family)
MAEPGKIIRSRRVIFLLVIGLAISIFLAIQAAVDRPGAGSDSPSVEAELDLQAEGAPGVWPGESWPISTPEEQGMDSQLLEAMFDFITQNRKNIQSLLVVRNGQLVVEAYFDPYNTSTKHQLTSASKSVTAILLGIALQEGVLRDLDQKIVEFFPEAGRESRDARKKEISLAHLLTMTAGLRWHEADRSYLNARNSLVQMSQHQDWLQYILNQPMAARPGEKFTYNSGASHLLSAILQEHTGLTAAQYAERKLFAPLGITDFAWEADPQGITVGGWGLMLTPRDMAKLGYLFLRGGRWEGEAVVPAFWVAESTRKHVEVISSSDFRYKLWQRLYRLFGREAAIRTYSYGYHWWIPDFGGFAARGQGGQAIFVIPTLDLVIVFTAGLPQADLMLPENLVEDYILPAAKSAKPLPADRPGQEALRGAIWRQAHPELEEEARLPETAARITGKRYQVKANPLGIQSFSFTFSRGSTAELQISSNNQVHDLNVGLDGLYRTNPVSELESMALKGRWSDENTLLLDLLMVTSGKKYEYSYTFQGETVRIVSHGIVEDKVWRMTGQME